VFSGAYIEIMCDNQHDQFIEKRDILWRRIKVIRLFLCRHAICGHQRQLWDCDNVEHDAVEPGKEFDIILNLIDEE